MMESQSMKPVYQLRLLERFTWYVERGSNLFRDWPKGAIVTDPEVIEFLGTAGPYIRVRLGPRAASELGPFRPQERT